MTINLISLIYLLITNAIFISWIKYQISEEILVFLQQFLIKIKVFSEIISTQRASSIIKLIKEK